MSSIDQALDLLRQDRQAHLAAIANLDTAIAALSGFAPAPPAPPAPRTRAPRQGTKANGHGTNGHRAAETQPAGSLADRVLTLATGRTKEEIMAACDGTRPNHVGIAIQRHVKAGRVEARDGRYYAAEQAAA